MFVTFVNLLVQVVVFEEIKNRISLAISFSLSTSTNLDVYNQDSRSRSESFVNIFLLSLGCGYGAYRYANDRNIMISVSPVFMKDAANGTDL